MEVGTVLIIVAVAIVAILVLVQIQIRKQYDFATSMPPEQAAQVISRAVGGGQALIDAAGDLSIPYRDGTLSVAIAETGPGSEIHVWLSQYRFLAANGFQVMGYKRKVSKIKRAVGAS